MDGLREAVSCWRMRRTTSDAIECTSVGGVFGRSRQEADWVEAPCYRDPTPALVPAAAASELSKLKSSWKKVRRAEVIFRLQGKGDGGPGLASAVRGTPLPGCCCFEGC